MIFFQSAARPVRGARVAFALALALTLFGALAWTPPLAMAAAPGARIAHRAATAEGSVPQAFEAGAPLMMDAPLRSAAVTVEATFSAPLSAIPSARLEYTLLDQGRWRVPWTIPLKASADGDPYAFTGIITFPLAGTWRVRQSLNWETTSCASAWVTVTVAAHRVRGRIPALMVGDSMAGMPGRALKSLLGGTAAALVVDYKSSSGVSRPDFFDWPNRVSQQVRRMHPKVVVMMFGANDWQNIKSQGRVCSRGTKAWDAAYARRLGGMIDVARAGDAVVYIVGQPIPGRSKGYARHMAHINAISESEALKRNDVRYVSSWLLFATPAGRYSSSLRNASGRSVLMRSRDKIHFSGAGASRLARYIRAQIQRDFGEFN